MNTTWANNHLLRIYPGDVKDKHKALTVRIFIIFLVKMQVSQRYFHATLYIFRPILTMSPKLKNSVVNYI